jgi:glycosyltransferase involved in cell wall biosynthesis
VRDTVDRNSHEAANVLAQMIHGDYCMIACSDDLWEPNYIARLMGILAQNPEVDLAYSNADWVFSDGTRAERRILRGRCLYRKRHWRFVNCLHFMLYRPVVPMIFGIFRTAAYRRTLPFQPFDFTMANVDNLFMLKFLVSSRVESLDEALFHYRAKRRWADPDVLIDYPRDNNRILILLHSLRHQSRFLLKIFEMVRNSPTSGGGRILLYGGAVCAFIYYFTFRPVREVAARVLRRSCDRR